MQYLGFHFSPAGPGNLHGPGRIPDQPDQHPAIVACPTSEWVSDRTGTHKWVAVVPMILIAPLFPLCLSAAKMGFLFLGVRVSFIGGFVPTGVFPGAVEAVGDERLSGMAMAVIQIGQNAGMLLGPLGWVV